MKKFIVILMLSLLFIFLNASAEDKANIVIPDYKCIINYCDIYYQDSIYPLISYKDITYFPMTWEYSRALNLSTSWVEGKGLYIAYHRSGGELPIYETTVNKKYETAVIPSYPIYINGKRMVNSEEEWPLLNYRGVTYFPMTWRYAHDEFNWTVKWDGTFTLNSYINDASGVTTTVYEIGEKSASVRRYASYYIGEDTDGDGEDDSFSYNGSSEKYYSFDYDTESLTPITFEHGDFYKWYSEQTYKGADEVSFRDGKILYEGALLNEVKALSEGKNADDIDGYAAHFQKNGVDIYNVTVYTEPNIPAPYTPHESFVYIKKDGQFIFIADNSYADNAAKMPDGTIYVNLSRYSGWRHQTFRASELYRIASDNTVSRVNDLYPDYGSMKIIGIAGGKLYLKCEWAANGDVWGTFYDVSPINDGYFTLEGGELKKVALFVETDSDFVTPDGRIFAVIQDRDEIRRIY